MRSRRPDPSKARAKSHNPVNDAAILKAIAENPDVQLVLEIAMRARDAARNEPPIYIGMTTEIIAN
jgi:hypothetical protein